MVGGHDSLNGYVHDVSIKKDSMLYEILGASKIKVNSRHMRCIPYTRLDVVAYSEDGIIEAIEDKEKKFFIGVQWHPESLIDDEYSNKLFSFFVKRLYN